jgi:hypothetical protein
MTTDHGSKDRALDALAKIQSQTLERLELEMNEIRGAMTAASARCEQSVATIRDARLVPLAPVSELVTALCAVADAERARAASAREELDAIKRELEELRVECRAQIAAAHEAAARYREETVASCLRELDAARELAMSAVSAEARVREELTALQTRNQEVVDAQMLRFAELKRELELASADTERSRAVAATASKPAPVKAPDPSPNADVILEPEPNRHHLAPLFSAIDAALAESPPVPVWEEKVGA